jgi:TonB-linked SusC/RagA family outer membrane protein
MKLTILLSVMNLVLVSAAGFSQGNRLTLNLKDATLKEAIAQIESQSNYSFLFKEDAINFNETVNLAASNTPIEEVLNTMLTGKNLEYKILDNALIVLLPPTESKQGQVVKGQVTDGNTGEPLPGVNIIIKGTTTGGVTDMEGKYSIELPGNETSLIFSFIGYLSDTIYVGSQTQINVIMVPDIQKLDEVVVIGYGTVKKSDLTGAVSVVSAEDIQTIKARDLTHAMQGMASGVQVLNSSGTPGSAPVIRIRGIGTINSADPLIVVDGVRMSVGDLEFINTNDIESVSVLKDASAAAIYGLGAANGVIMVTTKRATEGKISTSLNAYYGWQKPSHFMGVLSGPEWVDITNKVAGKQILDRDTVASANWFEEITRTAPIQNYDLSVTGGSEKSNFLFSAGYLGQEGLMVRTFYNRFTARLNSDHKLTRWLKVGENLNVARTKYENMRDDWDSYNRPITQGLFNPITPAYDENGNYQRRVYPQPYVANPLEEAQLYTTNNRKTAAIGALYAEATILKDFTLRSQYNYNYIIDESYSYRPGYDFGFEPVNRSELRNRYANYYTWLWETTLTYQKTLGSHNITALAGYTMSKFGQINDIAFTNSDGPYEVPEILRYVSSGLWADSSYVQTGGASYSSTVGFLGRVNYSFKDRYLLTASLRVDASSKFQNHLYENFPAFSLAWKISNEPWMKELIGSTSLKIRMGWGKTGNENVPAGAESEIIYNQMGYTFNNVWYEGRSVTTPANKNLKWETTVQKNIGIDAALWNNRIEVTADYFVRNTKDMLVQPAPPLVNGIPVMPYINAGEMLNKGFEFAANYRNNIGKLKYEVGGNFYHIKNEVISVGEEYGFITPEMSYGQGFRNLSRTEAGYPMAYFYGYKVEGIFQDYQEIREHAFQSAQTAPGDFKFKDMDGDGQITNLDQTMVGTPHPKLTYGFNINLDYLGFDLRTIFIGVYNVDILMPYKSQTHKYIEDGSNFSADLLDSWTPENTDTDIPRLVKGDPNGNLRAQVTSFYIEDGSYLRLKVLELGYTLPAALTSKVNISRLRFYISGQNLLTFTSYSGNDPEIGYSRGTNNYLSERRTLLMNVDFINVPQPRTWLFGLNLNF